jgi:hypothetical protein
MKRPIPLLCAVAMLAGCPPRKPPDHEPYYGVTDPMLKVVQDVNANASRIRTVWARHDFEALIYDDKGKSHSLSGTGTLQFRKPGDLLLKASGVIDYFEAGANDQVFWFTVYPKEVSTQWWGRKDQLTAEGVRRFPIRPDLLLETLGVSEIDTDFARTPVPVMRFNNDSRSYMFVWNAPVMAPPPARWIATREIWYDLDSKLPKNILLFDENGRVIVRAYLTEHKPIEGNGAKMATKYDLFFPDTKSRMVFHITTLMQELKKGPARFPNDATFVFPEDAGVEKRVEIR